MRLIDERGRLFGKANLIDVAVAVFVVLLVPLGYSAYLLFRVLPPRIDAIEPNEVVQGQTLRVRIRGANLRFLRIHLNDIEAPAFLLESPTSGEVRLPVDLKPGTYDLTMRDAGQIVARVPGALTVVSPRAIVAGDGKFAELSVRFLVYPDVMPLLHEGLEDQPAAQPAVKQPVARLLSFRKLGQVSGPVSINVGPDTAAEWFQVPQTVAMVDARVWVPINRGPDGWRYNAQMLKMGAPFTIETSLFFLRGWIVSIDLDTGNRPATDAKP